MLDIQLHLQLTILTEKNVSIKYIINLKLRKTNHILSEWRKTVQV